MSDIRYNQKTGEAIELVGGSWKPVNKSRMSVNKQTGEIAIFDGNAWNVAGRVGPVKPLEIKTPMSGANIPETFRREPIQLTGRELRAPDDSLASNVRDVGQRLSNSMLLGVPNLAMAGAQSAFPGSNETPDEAFWRELNELEMQTGRFAAEHPNVATAADIGGTVGSPLNFLGGEFIAGARSLPGQMARGAGAGGAAGSVGGFAQTPGGLDERIQGAEIGAGIGAGAGAALPLFGRAFGQPVRPEVQALNDRGIPLTPGQIMGGIANQTEEKIATVIPGLGDMITGARQRGVNEFNRAVYNEVLQPLGVQVAPDIPVGREGVAAVHDTIRQSYNQILQNVTFQVDQQLVADIQQATTIANRLPPQQRERFNQIIRDKIEDRLQASGGTLNGNSYKGMESELSNDVRGYSRSASHDERSLGEALGEVSNALRQSLVRTNPMYAGPLQATNAAFARLVRLEAAAGSVGNDLGVFTPQQFQSAVKAADSSSRKNAFAQGDALMQDLSDAGRAVLPNKFPNSGTPGRMAAAAVAGGGLGMVSPLALGVSALATLPYTQLGGRGLQAVMTSPGLRGLFARSPGLTMPFGIGGGQAGAAISAPPGAR